MRSSSSMGDIEAIVYRIAFCLRILHNISDKIDLASSPVVHIAHQRVSIIKISIFIFANDTPKHCWHVFNFM